MPMGISADAGMTVSDALYIDEQREASNVVCGPFSVSVTTSPPDPTLEALAVGV